MFFRSLVSRVIILNILLLTLGIGIFSLFHIYSEQKHLISSTRESAELLLSTIEKSFFNAMRAGNSQDVQATIELVGRNRRLRTVRIFHPDGTVLKSAKRWEIGQLVDPNDLLLFQNRRTEGVYRVGGEEVLGMVRPIYSEEGCFVCHGEGRKVVGVLNLNYSLEDTSVKLRETSKFFFVSSIGIIIILSIGVTFILLRFVKRPIHAMASTMASVEAGDLSARMVPIYEDEMGDLMHNFNAMVVNLEKAQNEVRSFHLRQMERADRLASVGEMATGLAHEIKNPLAGISGAISVLADDFPSEDPRRDVVDQVLEQIARLNKTVTDLLYFGRPGKPDFTFVDINALVRKTLFFMAQHPEAKNIHRIEEFTRDLPPLWVDEKQIQQVLFNLIINAVQSMGEGGTLSVRTDSVAVPGGELVRVHVTDSGKGIDEEDLEKIFVPFHTSKTQGTGLGLAICRQLLEQHGGNIRVQSRPGEGSTFIIELPGGALPVNGKGEQSA